MKYCIRGHTKIFLIISLCLLFLFLCPIQAFASSGDKKDDDKGAKAPEEIGVSLYDTQTSLAAYVNNVVGVNGNDKHDKNRIEDPQTVGNAGAYVGYGDEDKGFYSFVMSNLTHGASTSTYQAWQEICDSSSRPNQVYAYTRFGHVLADSGLDATASVGANPMRVIIGILTMFLYAMSEFVPKMFGFALKLLQMFNPFGFLSKATVFPDWWQSAFPSAPSQLTPLVEWISGTFDLIVNKMTWAAVVPFFIAVVTVQILLLRKKASTPILNLLKRIVFFAIGLPMCAGLYTGTLNSLQEITMHSTASSQIVVSTVVDFESWASNSHLAVPRDGLIASAATNTSDKTAYTNPADAKTPKTVNGGVATAEMLRNLRTTTYAINKKNNASSFSTMGAIPSLNDTHFMFSGDLWNKAADYSKVGEEAFQGLTDVSTDVKVSTGIFNLLLRYTNSSFYRATDFETTYTNMLSTQYRTDMGHMASTAGSSNRSKVYDMFNMTSEVDEWMEREKSDNLAIWKGSNAGSVNHLEWVSKPWNVFDGGELKVNTQNVKSEMKFTTPSGKKGLSTQSMYNYLSTSFDENSVVTYSNQKSVSENTKQQHYAVNIVGTGALNIAFTLNMIIILSVLVLIAFTFTFKVAVGNIKRGFQMICSVPGAMLGAIKSIAQVVSYSVVMICELVVSVFLYMFLSNMMILVATVVETLASSKDVTGLSSTILGAIGVSTGTNLVVMVLLESVLVLLVFAFLMKYRRAWLRMRESVSVFAYRFVSCKEMIAVMEQPVIAEHRENWLSGLIQDLSYA